MKKLLIISDLIRRDLEKPLRYFKRIEVHHLYRLAGYADMKKADFGPRTHQYSGLVDLWRKIKDIQPDIIQGPEPYASRTAFFNSVVVWKYCLSHRVPLIFPVLENRPVKIKFGVFLGTLMEIWLYLYSLPARKIFYLNEGARRNLLSAGIPESKLQFLMWGAWGVDTGEFKMQKSKIKMTNQNLKLLFVGRIEEKKGVLDLLEAFRILKKDFPKLELVVAGDGPLADKVNPLRQSADGGEPGVKYFGVVKNQDLPRYFQQATVTVAPSITTRAWEEQVGMVNIQSIACGTPVVSTKSGAIPEYIPDGQAGLLVPEKNPPALAHAIKKILIDKKLRQRLSIAGREYAKTHYSDRLNIAKAEEAVLKLIEVN